MSSIRREDDEDWAGPPKETAMVMQAAFMRVSSDGPQVASAIEMLVYLVRGQTRDRVPKAKRSKGQEGGSNVSTSGLERLPPSDIRQAVSGHLSVCAVPPGIMPLSNRRAGRPRLLSVAAA